MTTIEKIIKVVEALKHAAQSDQEWNQNRDEKVAAASAFGEWIAYTTVLDMLKDDATAESYFKIWSEEESANVDVP